MAGKKIIIEDLYLADVSVVIPAIDDLRKSGSVHDIPKVLDLLHKTKSVEVKVVIGNFLNDLKNEECVPLIIDAIKNKSFQQELGIIIESCWQSGLDYHSYLADFITLIINENYNVALEAFTVIENMLGSFSAKEIDEYITKLKSAMDTNDKNKSFLLVELIKVLEEFPKL